MKVIIFLTVTTLLIREPICAQFSRIDNSTPMVAINMFDEKQQTDPRYEKSDLNIRSVPLFNFRAAANKAVMGVVEIKVTFSKRTPNITNVNPDDLLDSGFWERFFNSGNGPVKRSGTASGVIISADGYIVTNNHVIENAESLSITLYDGRNFPAKVVGSDTITDIALLMVNGKGLPFIQFGSSDSIATGDVVLAVGNPFNLPSTVTAGIVSAKFRRLELGRASNFYNSFLQTDAVANSGNSGGALVDVGGRLIGMNSAMVTPTGSYAGYSFATPVEIVKKIADDIVRFGKVKQPATGIVFKSEKFVKPETATGDRREDLLIDSIIGDGAAMRAGLTRGDLLLDITIDRLNALQKCRNWLPDGTQATA